jgi:molecular chaperone Hsp33
LDNNLHDQYKKRDRLTRVMSLDGKFRVSGIKNTITMQTAQSRHKLPGIVGYYLAELMTGNSLMASFLKGEERLVVLIEGDGVLNHLYSEALHTGEVRGYATYETKALKLPTKSFHELTGKAFLKVSKILYNRTEPVNSILEMEHEHIADDLTNYYFQSEQVPTAMIIDVGMDESGKVKYSGGLIIQAMPGATKDDIKMVYDKFVEVTSLEKYFIEDYNTDQMLAELLPFEHKKIAGTLIDFFCRCSKEKIITKLLTLGMDEILKMREDRHYEIVCHYCNEHYLLSEADFDRLIDESLAKKN